MFKNKFFNKLTILCLILAMVCSMTACGLNSVEDIVDIPKNTISTESNADVSENVSSAVDSGFRRESLPDYNGEPWVYVNNDTPFFTDEEKSSTESFEIYSELDELGRCGVAFGCLSTDTQPNGEERGSLSGVTPSGWKSNGKSNNVKYDCVEGSYLYNRCHLIMWALSAENDNKLNLITGTRYMNIDGMLPWETMVDNYVDNTGNHVLYRVTPIYTGDNLVADGVLMEGYSIEDRGNAINFCVYAYNVQPGVEINYEDGTSWYSGVFFDMDADSVIYDPNAPAKSDKIKDKNDEEVANDSDITFGTYILNTNSKKIHTEDCEFGKSMSEKNREEYEGAIENLINEGYTRCSSCKP